MVSFFFPLPKYVHQRKPPVKSKPIEFCTISHASKTSRPKKRNNPQTDFQNKKINARCRPGHLKKYSPTSSAKGAKAGRQVYLTLYTTFVGRQN